MDTATVKALTPERLGRKEKGFVPDDSVRNELSSVRRELEKARKDIGRLEAEKVKAIKELDTARHALAFFLKKDGNAKKKRAG
jgi:uncharacterized protein (DUF3084 family)